MGLIIELTAVYIWLGLIKERIFFRLIQNTFTRCFMTPFKGFFKVWVKHLDNINSLKSKLNELKEYPFNTDHEHYLSHIDNNLILVNFSKFPQKIEGKKAIYNKKANDLLDLFRGCERFIEYMILKNALEYLHKIDMKRDDNGQVIPWDLGDRGGDAKLSQLLARELKDRILRGEKIDKPLFDSIDPTFYDKIIHECSKNECSDDAFKYFLKGLNTDINFQREYGCLKLFERYYDETEELVIDLLSDIHKI